MHALHTVHAVPDLRIAGGRLGDDCSHKISITTESFSVIAKALFTDHETAHTATVKSRRPKLTAQPQENDETGENLAQTAYESQSADFFHRGIHCYAPPVKNVFSTLITTENQPTRISGSRGRRLLAFYESK